MADKVRTRYATLALITSALTYALIVFGGIVRISGSGMGCGKDWPRCNGRLIPPLNDINTLIEWSHRMAAVLIGFAILGVGVYAWRHRRTSGFEDRKIFPLAMLAVGLLLVVVLFGRATVQLELPPGTVVAHLALASILLATLLVSALRALAPLEALATVPGGVSCARWALAAAGLGYVVVVLGGLVATTGAAPLCQGFPLCNGQVIPSGGLLVQLHWIHRLFAYGLVALVIAAAIVTLRQSAAPGVRRSALVAVGLVTAQVVVAVMMVLGSLPSELRALHLAIGVALWGILSVWSFLAGRLSTPIDLLSSEISTPKL